MTAMIAAPDVDSRRVKPMNLHATHAGASAPEKPSAMKFTYPSGARPLEGYTIKRGIGRGGFGEVYYALSDSGREVALKAVLGK